MNDDQLLKAHLNSETGKLSWLELQRHFARGVVIRVIPGVDLVEVAVCFSKDDNETVARLLATGQIVRATDEDAHDWQHRDPLFWAVVVAPWVLVQEIG